MFCFFFLYAFCHEKRRQLHDADPERQERKRLARLEELKVKMEEMKRKKEDRKRKREEVEATEEVPAEETTEAAE